MMKWINVKEKLPPRHARVNFCQPLLLSLDLGADFEDVGERYHVSFGIRWGIRERGAKFYSLDLNGRYPTDTDQLGYDDVTEYVIAWMPIPTPYRRDR